MSHLIYVTVLGKTFLEAGSLPYFSPVVVQCLRHKLFKNQGFVQEKLVGLSGIRRGRGSGQSVHEGMEYEMMGLKGN